MGLAALSSKDIGRSCQRRQANSLKQCSPSGGKRRKSAIVLSTQRESPHSTREHWRWGFGLCKQLPQYEEAVIIFKTASDCKRSCKKAILQLNFFHRIEEHVKHVYCAFAPWVHQVERRLIPPFPPLCTCTGTGAILSRVCSKPPKTTYKQKKCKMEIYIPVTLETAQGTQSSFLCLMFY